MFQFRMPRQLFPSGDAGPVARLAGVLLVAAAVLAAGSAEAQRPDSFAPLVEELSPSVVNISTVQEVESSQRSPFPQGSPFQEFFDEFFGPRGEGGGNGDGEGETRQLRSLGSGFVIDAEGYIVTNNHVVDEADEVTVRTVDGEEYTAEIVGRDPEVDLALLKIDTDAELKPVEWGDSGASRVGDWVLTIGNPFGLDSSVTAGIISAHHRGDLTGQAFDDFIQTDASINRGNSGGPMFNLDGEVIGVNTAIFSPSGGNVGIGFAIPSNQAKRVVAQLKEFGRPRRGFLGVTIGAVDELTAEALGLEEARGALVNSVQPDGPADKAGINPGDIILSFDGRDIGDSNELVRAVSNAGVEEEVKVGLLRETGERETVTLTTGLRPMPEEQQQGQQQPEPDGGGGLGASLQAITPQVRSQLDLPSDVNGAVVARVQSAELRGRLQRGDVITEVNRESVSSPDEVYARIAAVREEGKSAALLRIFRGGEFFFIPVPLEDDDKDGQE